jgi:hypothetical protein
MLHANYPIDRRSTWGPGRTRSPVVQAWPPRSQRDRAAVLGTLGEAFVLFDSRIRTLELWSKDVRKTSSRLELDWCIACLSDVRSALYQLHVCIVDEHLPLTPHGPAIVSYLSEAYVWCGDVLEDVKALVQELRGDSAVRDSALAEDSSAYIDDFLEPLFHEMCDGCQATSAGEPPMRALLPLAERLHVAIVSLDWVLKAA